MKLICIGRNYAEHAKEMDSAIPTEPIFFLKPDTAVIKDNQPFYYPDFSKEIHHEVELIIKISKAGKNIDPEFANKYYDEIGIGIDFTARDIQNKCKEKGLPWEKAKAFDGSAPIGQFIDKKNISDLSDINFHLTINENTVQKGNTKDLLFSFDTIIAYVSKFFTLKTGDLIFTGTPEGVGPVAIGDKLEAYIENKKLLSFEIK
ncbi:MAG: 2-hydroxyhepta-2,4-diene-1,7-dioate isomerase [Bacteroidetes bacterium RIFCSPLOWO2_12_FULL_35_15]|nr:MAG: 2-hydroxyhepta-2,4-diene-1,7-dioate isomerase [Bacteroidetes bacterium RIFCSPLOWO2_12_FULL_35_15]